VTQPTALFGVALVTSSALLAVGAAGCAALSRVRPAWSAWLGTAATTAACAIGGAGALQAVLRGTRDVTVRLAWRLPTGPSLVGVDALSAFFLLCIFVVSGLAALYGHGYLRGHETPARIATASASFSVLVVSMVGVVVARDGATFLVAWEVMTVSSFLLVVFHDRREEARRAGIVYLAASQMGAVLILALFVVLSGRGGSLAFAGFSEARVGAAAHSACFAFALLGFGLKAGFFPLHVWLPAAHPAAPSHVSALLSGVMIKMGIYGFVRALGWLDPVPTWAAALVVAVGIGSAILGVLHALAQHDLKRLLAYHSVENVGIIVLGIGIGLVGRSEGSPAIASLGFGAALLHVLGHGLFKGLLFQSAGSVVRATGTRDLDRMGGLGRSMPVTATAFLVGSVAICGLPPLNGFVSEWLLYVGALRAGAGSAAGGSALAVAVVASLALVGGLAAACFVKAYGVVFLGTPRTDDLAPTEAPASMKVAMGFGIALCALLGLWPEAGVRLVSRAAGDLCRDASALHAAIAPARGLARATAVAIALGGAIAWARSRLLRGREVRTDATWGCGYAAPTARMQYTGASFAAPLLAPFSPLVPLHETAPTKLERFPTVATDESHPGDLAGEHVVEPLSRGIAAALLWLRLVQYGRIQLYLAYVFVTLIALVVWLVARGVP
jgi:hydrogenase-4 component B